MNSDKIGDFHHSGSLEPFIFTFTITEVEQIGKLDLWFTRTHIYKGRSIATELRDSNVLFKKLTHTNVSQAGQV